MYAKEIAMHITLKALEDGRIALPAETSSPEENSVQNAKLIGSFYQEIYRAVESAKHTA